MFDWLRRLRHVGEAKESTINDIFKKFFFVWFPIAMGISVLFLIMVIAGYIIPGFITAAVGYSLFFMAFKNWQYNNTMSAQGFPWFAPFILSVRPEYNMRLEISLTEPPVLVTSPLSEEISAERKVENSGK